MGELINLRRAKKAKARSADEKTAAANRMHYGTPKKLRDKAAAEKSRAEHAIEAHKLDDK
jgi:hypothetical protein